MVTTARELLELAASIDTRAGAAAAGEPGAGG